MANEQSAGQGTRGRVWVAPKGTSLLASWIVRPAPVAPALFAALAGVAIARVLESLARADARLEWPNDVHVGGRKVAGALAHATSDGDGGVLVLGIGINVHQRPEDFPAELRERAISLASAGYPLDRLALLARLTRELDRLEDTSEPLDVPRQGGRGARRRAGAAARHRDRDRRRRCARGAHLDRHGARRRR